MARCSIFNLKVILVLFFICYIVVSANNKRPNIVVILADDMGWNDVSFHGANQIPTPNIDALAYNGVILNNHYAQALCTPSRAAFLTGKYPIHTGMQHLVLLEPEPRGLPLEEKLLPEYLREAGYSTHAVGKWHLGFYKHEYTPLYRGFDTHYGYYNGLQDYYTHYTQGTYATNMSGYDMRRNLEIDWDAKGKYSTTLFTEEAVRIIKDHNTDHPMFMYLSHLAPHSGNKYEPLQAPDEEIAKFSHIEDPERRIYAAMVSMLDKGVGEVMAALREKRMLENSIVIFMSDNGAQSFGIHANHGSNYPLKGLKATPWEGGSRTVAAIWSPLLKNTQYVSDHLMHISDWMPTLFNAAGINQKQLENIDGIDMWEAISENKKSPRNDMVYNIDDTFNYSAIRKGDWKYVFGTLLNGKIDGWYGDNGTAPIYNYDEDLVINSQSNIALIGAITQQQIKEKNEQVGENAKSFSFSHNLLTKEKMRKLRNLSTVKCNKKLDETSNNICNPMESPCLFNLRDDPCELINLANERPVILKNLENALQQYRKTIVPQTNQPDDPKADPALWNNTWVWWYDCELVIKQKIDSGLSPSTITILAVLCGLFFIVVMFLIAISVKYKRIKKPTSNADLFANNFDSLDAPTGVIHVITEDSTDKIDNFQNSESTRHHNFKNDSKNIN